MKKDLSGEFKEILAESKALVVKSVDLEYLSSMDGNELSTNIQAMLLLNRLADFSAELFEVQIKLMDKLDKVLDKQLAD